MSKKQFLLVEASILPDVYLRVLRAKEMLAAGQARNVSQAAKMADVSRSAFYKYKDSVFRSDTARETVTITAKLLDETGALQSLLSSLSAAGADVVTINQSIPENGTASVAVTLRTGALTLPEDELVANLAEQRTVVSVSVTK
ncbi:MAG: amino acid-binding protein [Oscillospiraceae bacterium]